MVAEAEQVLARSRSQLADLGKGKRPSEIKAIEPRLAQAIPAQVLAEKEFARLEQLVNRPNWTPPPPDPGLRRAAGRCRFIVLVGMAGMD